MAITRTNTYHVYAAGDTERTSPVVVTLDISDDDNKYHEKVREAAGRGERSVIEPVASIALGAEAPDIREYDIQVKSTPRREKIRARSIEDATVLGKLRAGDDFARVGGSTRVTDADLVVEAIAQGFEGDPADVAAKLLLPPAKYVDTVETSRHESWSPEHYVFADGSVCDDQGKHSHSDLSEMESSMAEAAWEQYSQDAHAGDSGHPASPAEQARRAHADRAELRSKDGGRPSLSSGAGARPAPAADGSPEPTVGR